MRKILMYLIVYSIGGFVLERVINLFAYGRYVDNRVMFGFWQPLYGVGIVLAIIIYNHIIKPYTNSIILRNALLVFTAILTTGLSEAFHGYGYELFKGGTLWDYRDTFPCSIPYVCVVPTTLFGIGSYLAIKFIHPFIVIFVKLIPKILQYLLIGLFLIDYIITAFLLIT